jgi:enoyl-CoA hydratase/carnithine racemase
MGDHVIVEQREQVLEIRLNRPDKRNALTDAMYGSLIDAFQAAGSNPAIRAVVISGEGEGFTAGNDLNDFIAFAQSGGEPGAYRFLKALVRFEKPLIAAVRGAAVGIGTTLLLHCDLVVAARNSRFQLPFVNLGLVPEAGSSLLLPRLVGLQRASEMLLLGEAIDAETALQFGLVNRLVEDGLALETARGLASQIAAKPPGAIRETKRLVRLGSEAEERIDAEMLVFRERLASPELREAAMAFFEKRKPDFSKF